MPLMLPTRPGFTAQEASPTTPAAGTTLTASGSTHTMGSITELIASTARDSYGIYVMLENTAVSNTSTDVLVDILRGGSGSEEVLIPYLYGGFTLSDLTANVCRSYYFPLFIPAGTRLSARCQSQVASKTVTCRIRLDQRPRGLYGWVGNRVTAYGVVAASSRGTLHTSGNGSYATATQLTASTTNPIRYMQMSFGGGSDSSLSDQRYYARIVLGATAGVLVEDLPLFTDTGVESTGHNDANAILERMMFDLPAGVDLRVSGRTTASTNNVQDFIVYGVD
jgi:hypothetical protein